MLTKYFTITFILLLSYSLVQSKDKVVKFVIKTDTTCIEFEKEPFSQLMSCISKFTFKSSHLSDKVFFIGIKDSIAFFQRAKCKSEPFSTVIIKSKTKSEKFETASFKIDKERKRDTIIVKITLDNRFLRFLSEDSININIKINRRFGLRDTSINISMYKNISSKVGLISDKIDIIDFTDEDALREIIKNTLDALIMKLESYTTDLSIRLREIERTPNTTINQYDIEERIENIKKLTVVLENSKVNVDGIHKKELEILNHFLTFFNDIITEEKSEFISQKVIATEVNHGSCKYSILENDKAKINNTLATYFSDNNLKIDVNLSGYVDQNPFLRPLDFNRCVKILLDNYHVKLADFKFKLNIIYPKIRTVG